MKLKVGDKVILDETEAIHLYDGVQIHKEQYKELDINRIEGTITELWYEHSHYLYGIFANIQWDNNTFTDTIHVCYLKKILV